MRADPSNSSSGQSIPSKRLRPRTHQGRRLRLARGCGRRKAARYSARISSFSLGPVAPALPGRPLMPRRSATASVGHLVPGAPVELAAAGSSGGAPPHCLKKNATPSCVAAIAQLAQPLDLAPGGAAAPDSPPAISQSMPVELEPFKRTEQRLGGDEPHGGGDLAQAVGAVNEAPVLDRDAHPDVRRPRQVRRQLREPLVALRQDLEDVPVGPAHDLEDLSDVGVGNRFVEQVAHRVDEDHPRPRHAADARDAPARAAGRSPARKGARACRASARRTSPRSSGRNRARPWSSPSPGSRSPRSTRSRSGRPSLCSFAAARGILPIIEHMFPMAADRPQDARSEASLHLLTTPAPQAGRADRTACLPRRSKRASRATRRSHHPRETGAAGPGLGRSAHPEGR